MRVAIVPVRFSGTSGRRASRLPTFVETLDGGRIRLLRHDAVVEQHLPGAFIVPVPDGAESTEAGIAGLGILVQRRAAGVSGPAIAPRVTVAGYQLSLSALPSISGAHSRVIASRPRVGFWLTPKAAWGWRWLAKASASCCATASAKLSSRCQTAHSASWTAVGEAALATPDATSRTMDESRTSAVMRNAPESAKLWPIPAFPRNACTCHSSG